MRRLAAGWKPDAIVIASGGQVRKETVQRWVRTFLRLELVQVGDHVATFVIRRERPPVRVSVWQYR